jgi:hypothetical protein
VIFPGYATPVSSTNKTGCHDIVEVLLKVALNTITPNNPIFQIKIFFRNEINEDDETHKAYATPLLEELLLNIDKKAILFPWLEEIAGKITDLLQVTDKLLSHKIVSNTSSHEWDSNSQLDFFLNCCESKLVYR